MDQFSALAKFYDRFVGADYPAISAFIDQKIKQYKSDSNLVCDIGCGSGNVTLSLLENGYDMIGIDGSIDMLTEALNKRAAVEGGERALFLCQQLPDFELYGTVDCIISTLDTLNYITKHKDLDKTFYWFRNYLDPNGLLIFDINTEYKYQSLLDGHCSVYDEEDVFMAWHSQYDGELCRHKLTVFSNENGEYSRSDEEQIQRYYSLNCIKELLAKYHFEILEICDDYSANLPSDKTQRLTIVARKEN